MLVDLLMKMLTAVLAQREASDLLHRIAQETAQGPAILARAAELRIARPVPGRFDGLGCGRSQLGQAVLQQLCDGWLCRWKRRTPVGHRLHRGNESFMKV